MQSGTPQDGDTWRYDGNNGKWKHQMLHASIIDNDSAISGQHVDDALNNLNSSIANKLDANPSIVSGTATKVVYDAKGLITSGGLLAANDIPFAVDAARIGTGAVSNTEFGYLDGVTSSIQTQINNLGVPAIMARGTAVALISVGATAWTTATLGINLVAGASYYIEACWMLQPTFNPTGGGRVGFSWSGTLTNFHGAYAGSVSEIAVRNGSVVSATVGGLFPSNTPYLASDITRNALAPTIFRGYCSCTAASTLTMGLAAVTGGATISLSPRGSYIKAIRIA
jgi:hypothetical protein